MSDMDENVIDPNEGRSALEKHIFGLSENTMGQPSSTTHENSNLLRDAIALHEAGNFTEAEAKYRKFLSERPNVP
ncbi:MAG: hypothetical protein R3261_03330, partial [Alphaproteobacteria bacterium]|nr:hypothetical protein [Alphaproteobacteria bacterium]